MPPPSGLTLGGRPLSKLLSRNGEDPGRVHALCGALAFIHIAFRVAQWLLHRTCGFDASWATLLCMLPHLGLVRTAFLFHLPAKRHPTVPMLWPMFRAHAAIFSVRSLAVMTLAWFALRARSPDTVAALLATRGLPVLAAGVAADAVNDGGSTSIRGIPWPRSWPKRVRSMLALWYAFSQLLASCMFTAYRLDTAFSVLAVIQLSAFLATLCRKGLLSCAGWHLAYASMLAAVLLQHVASAPVRVPGETQPRTRELWLFAPAMALFALLRFRYRFSKYLLWPAFMATHAAVARRWHVLDCVVAP